MKRRHLKKGKTIKRKAMRQKSSRHLRRPLKLACAFLCVILAVLYLSSDIARVQEVNISGNKMVSTKRIESSISVDTDRLFLMTRTKTIEKELANMGLIKKAKVTKNLKGQVNIKVKEDKIVAYFAKGNDTYVIDESGEITKVDKDINIKSVRSYPRMVAFNNDQLITDFSAAYINVPEIIKNSVSDIIYAPKPQDDERIRLVMNDGKELIIRIDEMETSLKTSHFNYQAYMSEFDDYKIFSFEGKHIYMSK